MCVCVCACYSLINQPISHVFSYFTPSPRDIPVNNMFDRNSLNILSLFDKK